MKLWGWTIAAASGLLLGSASPPPPAAPYLPVDAAALEDDQGCPDGAGNACILLSDGSGQLVLAGIPGPAPETLTAPAAAVPPAAAPVPASSAIRVVISLPQQKAYVFRAGALVATAPVSTGRPGHPTPVGTFRILQKAVTHHSNRYSNAPMPFMQRLTDYGIALHAGALPGYPASHGCIRLPRSFARKLYGMTDYATRVTITRSRLDRQGRVREA